MSARSYYAKLTEFVADVLATQTDGPFHKLDDIGCGSGGPAYCFAERGFAVTGINLNAADFEPPDMSGLQLQAASGMALLFVGMSFDVAVSYQCLEHILDHGRALDEMIRVLRPRAVMFVVGRNLASPVPALRLLVAEFAGGTWIATRKG